ncbi:MAG: serine/threonine-protein kinase, partial [Ignavibacteria bacterium]|nr:serine/threonine-protein kinase [Ignavibacteria bacterium]
MSAILKRLEKGETINDTYEVQFYLGEGAFGEVYRVKHKYLGVQVLKLFKQDYLDNTDTNTLTNEAKILSQLTHNNIVRVFETNTFIRNNKKYFFMTMGFVAGETLSQLIKRKIQLPIELALLLQKDILTGLNVAHGHNPTIIHRDINPDNILLSYENEKPRALLGDFGLAQSISSFSKLPNAGGRYLYFAPECFLNTYLPASDVFSAGIVLFRLITGVHPWQYDFNAFGESPDEIETMILNARKTAPKKPSLLAESCSDWLDKVILTSLSRNIEDRFKNAGEFYEALTNNTNTKNKPSKKAEEKIVKSIPNVEQVPKKKTYRVKVHGKGFDEIAGMDELKETLYHDIILPLKDKELYEEYKVTLPNGMLLYGPPGCG